MKFYQSFILFLMLASLIPGSLSGQEDHGRYMTPVYPLSARAHDSVLASKVPVLAFPGLYHKRQLPFMVDNSQNQYWPHILDQFHFYTCQQFAGVAYVFGYEINRLRDQPGWYWENSYSTHYTWNFMNRGERYTGVNFLQSFEVIKEQGHMTSNDYGADTATSVLGWISGYEKYYRGMFNHLKQVYTIRINSIEGINTLKNYLYDHLEGSGTGGIACFTTSSSSLNNMPVLPEGTPEAGKFIVLRWQTVPVHGLAVVGYNDSIRYDVNGDGQFTNNIDITGDGAVDACDWEIGAFKIANSYGTSYWGNDGFTYALYRSFALNYDDGGVWNNQVFVVEADPDYQPLFAVKVTLNYNSRDKIRVLAGVSADTLHQMPDHVIDFPIFNFQGGDHVMQGTDTVAEAKTIEFGLDVTPLLNFVSPGAPARYFLMVEERDPGQLGQGTIQQASFINYQDGMREFPVGEQDVSIRDNNVTMVSVVGTMKKPDVQITSSSLPPLVPDQPYQVQLEASGGIAPYDWSVLENYTRIPSGGVEPMITGTSIHSHETHKPYVSVALPFRFPFYGKKYDSIYVNNFGFITFEPHYLPEPFVTDEMSMLEMFGTVTPSFSQNYIYQASKNDGIWFQADDSQAVIRWKVSVSGHENTSVNDFALILYPDGQFEFRFGTMTDQGFLHTFYTGVSKGDEQNFNLETQWDANDVSGKSYLFIPPVLPSGLTLAKEGLLTVTQADSSQIYDLQVQVADAGKITDSKVLMLSGGLELAHQLICGAGNRLEFGCEARMKLVLTNTGIQPLHDLHLKITSVDSLLQITDSIFTVPLLQSGSELTIPGAFSFGLKQSLPDDFPVRLALHAQSGQRIWQKKAQFPVSAPDLIIESPEVRDGDNNILDPGEVAELIVNVINSGDLEARNLQLKFISLDPGITILSAPEINIDLFGESSLKEFSVQISASREILPGSEAAMQILLGDSSGIIVTHDFILRIGTRPIALVNLATSHASALAMINALDSLHVGYDTINSLPFDYDRYTSVFLILGTAASGSHVLTVSEAASLADYLDKGGNLYMEGYHTWYYLNRTPLHPYFKYASNKIPAYYYPAVTGTPGTFTSSMSYDYLAPLNFAVFSLEPKDPAYPTLINTDSPAKNLEIVYDGSDYKTIGTMLGFNALTGDLPPSTQTTLMERYLEFFGVNISGPYALFHAGMTAVCLNQPVTFTDDSFDNITSRSWEFQGGNPVASNEANPVVRYDAAGKFDVKLTVSDGTHTKTILRQKYIHAGECSGFDEHASAQPLFKLFPNPANDQVTIGVSPDVSGSCKVMLFDVTGCKLMEIQQIFPVDNNIILNLRGLGKGLYFVSVQAKRSTSTLKLILN